MQIALYCGMKQEAYSVDQCGGGAIWIGHCLNGLVGGLATSRRVGL